MKHIKKPQNTKMYILIDYLTVEIVEKLLRKQWIYTHNTDNDEDIFHHIGLREYDGSPKEVWNAWKGLKQGPYRNG